MPLDVGHAGHLHLVAHLTLLQLKQGNRGFVWSSLWRNQSVGCVHGRNALGLPGGPGTRPDGCEQERGGDHTCQHPPSETLCTSGHI